MGGPAVSVVFASEGNASWRIRIEEMIALVSCEWDKESFTVLTTRPIGGSYDEPDRWYGRPFAIDWDEQHWQGEAFAETGVLPPLYEQVFGRRPDSAITFIAMCNGQEDHSILAELALAAVERIGGIIDMGGLLVPRDVFLATPDYRSVPWSTIRKSVTAFADSMPGTAIAVQYQTINEREWALHMVDAAFLRAWLHHPEFRMIK